MGVVTQPISITELALPEGALCPRAGHYKINEPCDAPPGWFGRRHTKLQHTLSTGTLVDTSLHLAGQRLHYTMRFS